MDNVSLPLQPTVKPMAPYSSRPPSPPYIHVPPFTSRSTAAATTSYNNGCSEPASDKPNSGADNSNAMTIYPSPTAVHTMGLSPADLHAITCDGAPQSARIGYGTPEWVYEARRGAQPVLDYLYLGPASAVRDGGFLAREGITMVLCVRDARFLVPPGSATAPSEGIMVAGVRRAVEGIVAGRGRGLEVDVVDVGEGRAVVGAFLVAAGKINAHVLRVSMDGGGSTRGKVLVVCETGNDRSAVIVAAYLMAMYGLDTVGAVQFMQLKRFCVTLGDEIRFLLQSYGDILKAKGDVGAVGDGHDGQRNGGVEAGNMKRRIEQTRDGENGGADDMMDEMDAERYAGRDFAPFVERDMEEDV